MKAIEQEVLEMEMETFITDELMLQTQNETYRKKAIGRDGARPLQLCGNTTTEAPAPEYYLLEKKEKALWSKSLKGKNNWSLIDATVCRNNVEAAKMHGKYCTICPPETLARGMLHVPKSTCMGPPKALFFKLVILMSKNGAHGLTFELIGSVLLST